MFGKIATCTIVLSLVVMGQGTDLASQMEQRSSSPAAAGSRDYELGPGDLLEIAVFGVEDLNQVVRVSAAGTITLPLIGRIEVTGLTGEQLQAHITDLLAKEKLVRDPQVTVFIKEYHSQPVYVLGAVNQPGQYMISQRMRLLDALSMAGGLDMKKAGDHLLLQRRAIEPNGDKAVLGEDEESANSGVINIDLQALLEKGDASLNISVKGGDVIQVPERKAEVFYVVGDVLRSGEFPFDKQRNISVLGALSVAGGLGRTAKPEKAMIFREVEGAPKRQEIAVNIKHIMRGKAEDIALRADDILVVPTSGSKTFSLYVLPTAVAAAVGAAIWAGTR
jgi:polysaccharide export outer membrane protein